MKTKSIASLAAATAVSVLLLSGCSAVGNAVKTVTNEQTKVQACKTISSSLTTFGTDLSSISSTLASDPKGASAKISTEAAKFQKSADSLTNPAVKKAAEKTATSINSFSKSLSALATSPSTANDTKLQSSLTALESSMTSIETSCK